MVRFIFAFTAVPGGAERAALLLARSVRAFAGEYADSPIWALVPESAGRFPDAVRREFVRLSVRVVPFGGDPDARDFPFGAKVCAAAAAEALAQVQAACLVWMDAGSLVIQEPRELQLEAGEILGCRPVDHTVIGSPYDEPTDEFWRAIYRYCGVADYRVFPVTATVDQRVIRAYFNAGLLVVRPEWRLLRAWRDNFLRLYREPAFEACYQRNRRYVIFVHQAALAGTVLAMLERSAIREYPRRVNYPLHMHAEYPPELRPQYMNELVTARYEEFFDDPNWAQVLPAREPLQGWLSDQLAERRPAG